MKFKFLEHKADAKFQAFGKTIEEAFANASLAMFSIMHKKPVKPKIKKKIKVKGKDYEALLYSFLEELLFLLDSENFFLAKVEKIKIIEVKGNSKTKNKKGKKYNLEADVSGDNAGNYETSGDVKAVTYNEMFIKKSNGKWTAQVIVDL